MLEKIWMEMLFLTDFSITLNQGLWTSENVNTECWSILFCLFPQPGGGINTIELRKIRYLLLWFHRFSNNWASMTCLYISCLWANLCPSWVGNITRSQSWGCQSKVLKKVKNEAANLETSKIEAKINGGRQTSVLLGNITQLQSWGCLMSQSFDKV